jgi:hypothetical protein
MDGKENFMENTRKNTSALGRVWIHFDRSMGRTLGTYYTTREFCTLVEIYEEHNASTIL